MAVDNKATTDTPRTPECEEKRKPRVLDDRMREGLRTFLIVGCIAAACFYYCVIWDPFNRDTADALVLNKTRAQIIQLLGPPTLKDSVDPESALTYKSGGEYVRIYLNDRGIADRTMRWTK